MDSKKHSTLKGKKKRKDKTEKIVNYRKGKKSKWVKSRKNLRSERQIPPLRETVEWVAWLFFTLFSCANQQVDGFVQQVGQLQQIEEDLEQ